MSKEEVKSLAKEMGLTFPDDAKRLEIISLIKNSKLPASDPSDVQESLE
jgi:ferritin-like protein